MKLNTSIIEKSKKDITRKLVFPQQLTVSLAELIGIIIGDGHLSVLSRSNGKSKFLQSDLFIAANRDEKDYIQYICSLFFSLFSCNLAYRIDKRSKAVLLTFHSKGIVQYFNKVCQIPLGKKTEIVGVPPIIFKGNVLEKCAFLRGIADTDYYIAFKRKTAGQYSYPVIRGSFRSKQLVKDLEALYRELGFVYCVVYEERHYDPRIGKNVPMNSIYLNGKKNFYRWIDIVGFSNLKNLRKVRKWQEDGSCPPGH